MAPPKRPPKTQEEARASNNCLMTDFSKCESPGHTNKIVILSSDDLDVCRAPTPPSQAEITKKPKKYNVSPAATTAKPLGVVPRKNYSVGYVNINLENAVSEWFSDSGVFLYNNEEGGSLKPISFEVGTPYNNFQKYVQGKEDTLRKIGNVVGRLFLIAK